MQQTARPSAGGERTRAQWSVVRRACVTCVYPRCVSKGTRVFGRQTLPSPSKFNSAALCTKETEQATLWDALITTNNALLYDAHPPLRATPALLSRQSDPSGECQGWRGGDLDVSSNPGARVKMTASQLDPSNPPKNK